MVTPIHLHLFGADPKEPGGPAKCLGCSPALSEDERAALEKSIHYGSPERPGMAPPLAWSLSPLSERHSALTRTWRAPATLTAPSPVVAISAVFPAGDDLLGTGAVLDLAESPDIFPERPAALPDGPMQRELPANSVRTTDAFDRLLQTVRGERKAIVALLSACATALEPDASLRAVILSLPDVGFRESAALLRTMVGLAAALPRELRTRLSFATYQDSPAPRPMPLLAIPDSHRCMPRLVRSNGYVVFPGPPPAETLLSPRATRYAARAADLLLNGRFEEVRALSVSQASSDDLSSDDTTGDIERHAELLRIAEAPTCQRVLDWIEANGVPAEEERQELLFASVAGAVDAQSREGDPGPAAQLLRNLARRWPEPDWERALLERLRPALVRLLAEWRDRAGWTAIQDFFGRLASGGLWLRGAVWESAALALASQPADDEPDQATFAAFLEEVLEGLENVQPPPAYVRWRAQRPELGDALRDIHLDRLLALPHAQEILLDLLQSFDSPESEHFKSLFAKALSGVLRHRREFAVDLVADLAAHYRDEAGGLEVVSVALDVFRRAEAEGPMAELVAATLLRASQGSARFRRRHAELLAKAGRAAQLDRWRDEVSRVIAGHGHDRALLLGNLRRLWTAMLDDGRGVGSHAVAEELSRIERAEPELCRDPFPHEVLLYRGGPGASSNLAVDEIMLLAATGQDEDVERHLAALFSVYSRRLPDDPWSWQSALFSAALDDARPTADRALTLWWFWSAGRRHGFPVFARHAARRLTTQGLLHDLDAERFELLCRLLPSGSGFDRERLVRAAVEGTLGAWRGQRDELAPLPPELFRLFSPQADRVSEKTYIALVRRYAEECLLLREPAPDDLRTLLDRVYVPRYWEALAALFQELGRRRPKLRNQLAGLRKTTLGRRLPPQLLGYFAGPSGPSKPPTTTLE